MAKPILDISYYQPPDAIDYDQLADEVDGVILRAAYGTRKDTAFERHYSEFTKRNIPVGAYHFIVEYKPIAEQAQVFLNAVSGKTLKLGYWCDVEYETGADRLTAQSVIGWMNGVEAKLGACGVYAANWCWRSIMQDEYTRYSSRKLWCAAYTEKVIIPPGWDDYYLWQYTSSGRLPGYNGNLDMNKRGNQAMDIKLNGIKLFSQRDPLWKDDRLGACDYTVGGSGCLITGASTIARYYGHDTDPGRLNKEITDRGLYVNGCLFAFDSMNALFPGMTMSDFIDCATVPAPLDKIDALLLEKKPMLVKVDFDVDDDDIDQHWVVIIGKVGGSYIIHDPWDGQEKKFEDDYGDPARYIFRIVAYNGVPNPLDDDGEAEDPEPLPAGKVTTLVNLNIRKGAGTSYGIWATAKKGTILDVLEIKGDWVRVGWNQWALSNYNGVRYLE